MDNYNEYMTYKKSNTYPEDFIVFDFETTGLSAEEENIIEIGAIKYKGNKKVDVFNTYVNPQKLIPSYITKITGIKNNDVINAPKIEEALPKFLDFIGNDIIIAHNANFDMKFLLTNTYNLNIDKPTNEVIDTLSLSRKYMKDSNGSKLPSYKLEMLKKHLNINIGSHNALDDCIVCAQVYMKCKENF
jgi:DNA polymerase-3 subunit epsilon